MGEAEERDPRGREGRDQSSRRTQSLFVSPAPSLFEPLPNQPLPKLLAEPLPLGTPLLSSSLGFRSRLSLGVIVRATAGPIQSRSCFVLTFQVVVVAEKVVWS